MNSPCIHGFLPEHCASCRTCQHGVTASACLRCRATVTSRKAPVPSVAAVPMQEHAGYEIFFEPDISGWRYRASDAPPSQESYRSAFLARKAVDQLGTVAVADKKPRKKRG